MKDYQLFLIDLDGTIYRGKDTIAAGVRFVHRLEQAGKDYLFLTNNTTRTPQMVVDKLAGHGIKTDIEHVYTPCMATVSYLRRQSPQLTPLKFYLIGEIGLWHEFLQQKDFELDPHHPDYVIVGMDRDLTYRKVQIAADAIRSGATFIGTNADVNLPSDEGLLPGNGSQCAMIAVSSGQEPLYIGKPSAIIVEMALAKMKCSKERAILVGDNYDTDIKAGFNSQVDQLLVTTGITQPSDIKDQRQPTYVVGSLDQFEL
ncbi:TIGR01457 family HAD-type hydrolase [Lactobacillus sp. ESL0731]|uniref:TIGR01457 family HAD-type hydrolase n=1 Tax=unclassified Lactobacillus TaxID=2620435 RepID=UPI0023F93BD8|nr:MULTISPECIES: TIGR01457 family HAD-type hydrolase [unclassified Lactobacillus]WEV51509.1 TIGR01457 family HAD-type hydrolase [Lactobacillus sp. ESL0700]WEV62637.1 TIGR01457 family HAD-type hydrolase [Lactobacillus sp. ESL0731]